MKKNESDVVTIDESENTHVRNGIFAKLWLVYHGILDRMFMHKIKVMIVVAGLFILSFTILGLSVSGIVPLIKIKFFPGNYLRYHIAVSMPPGTPIEKTDQVIREMSNMIISLGENQAESAWGAAGYYEDEDYRWLSGSQYGQVVVTLPDRG